MPYYNIPKHDSNRSFEKGRPQNFKDSRANWDVAVPNPYENYHRSGNLGMLYSRCYYGEINLHVLDKETIKVVSTKTKKGYEETNHQSLYYKSRNDNLIKQAVRFQAPDPMPNANADPILLQSTYPGMLIGVGIPHAAKHEGETQLGLSFDHSTGLPYIPGSSVKGVLRSMFPLQDIALADKCEKKGLIDRANRLRIQADEKREFIAGQIPNFKPKMVDDLERSIFIGTEYDSEKKDYVQIAERDIFFDAFPTASKSGLLGTDFITPHTKGEFQNPGLIHFMRIAPDVTFRFEFRLKDSRRCGQVFCDATSKRELLRILKTVGIGAKTNVGYGQLGEVSQSSKTATVEVSQKVGIQIANEELVNTNVDSSIEANDETPIEITPNRPANPQIEEKICTGKLEKLPGLGLKVRIEDPKYSEAFYDLRFKQNNDIKQIKRGTTRVRVALKVKNNKVIEVWFKGVIA